jgi:hypothetical protein
LIATVSPPGGDISAIKFWNWPGGAVGSFTNPFNTIVISISFILNFAKPGYFFPSSFHLQGVRIVRILLDETPITTAELHRVPVGESGRNTSDEGQVVDLIEDCDLGLVQSLLCSSLERPEEVSSTRAADPDQDHVEEVKRGDSNAHTRRLCRSETFVLNDKVCW